MSAPDPISLAREYATDPELWQHLVHHDPERRTWALLRDDEEVTAWVICWSEDSDTGYHDHDVSAGAVSVVAGQVVEERLRIGGPPSRRVAGAGDAFAFGPQDIHRVLHAGGPPAVTIHVYAPPLRRQGAYVIDPDGTLSRLVLSETEELRPISVGADAPSSGPEAPH